MSNKKKKYAQYAAQEKAAQEIAEDQEKEKKAEFRSALIVVYFLAAFGVTAYATDHHALSYGQLSIVYLPMFFIFLYWQIQRFNNVENGHSRLGNILAIAMCLFVIVVTSCVTFGSWMGIL